MQTSFPSNISDIAQYEKWRAEKLAQRPVAIGDLLIQIADPFQLTDAEIQQIKQHCDTANMCFYRLADPTLHDKRFIRAIGEKVGLFTLDNNLCADYDSITSLQTRDDGRQKGYIPYSPSRIGWHTDGYYNSQPQMVRGLILHCARNAAQGGVNELLDPDLLYIHLRDLNPDYISALMQEDAMSIPPNVENGKEIRGTRTGSVISHDKNVDRLHMRYTARTKSIDWKPDPLIAEALTVITEFLQSDSDWIFRHCLQPGEGVICNNVLHNRSAYEDSSDPEKTRLLFRARYFERVLLP